VRKSRRRWRYEYEYDSCMYIREEDVCNCGMGLKARREEALFSKT